MLFNIHDLPVKYPMQPGVSFHATDDAVDRIWWDGEVLEIVTVIGEVWRFNFDEHQWSHTETIWVEENDKA